MKTKNGRYGPAFKFKMVLEALRAEGRGVEAEVARAYRIHRLPCPTGSGGSSSEVRKHSGVMPQK